MKSFPFLQRFDFPCLLDRFTIRFTIHLYHQNNINYMSSSLPNEWDVLRFLDGRTWEVVLRFWYPCSIVRLALVGRPVPNLLLPPTAILRRATEVGLSTLESLFCFLAFLTSDMTAAAPLYFLNGWRTDSSCESVCMFLKFLNTFTSDPIAGLSLDWDPQTLPANLPQTHL